MDLHLARVGGREVLPEREPGKDGPDHRLNVPVGPPRLDSETSVRTDVGALQDRGVRCGPLREEVTHAVESGRRPVLPPDRGTMRVSDLEDDQDPVRPHHARRPEDLEVGPADLLGDCPFRLPHLGIERVVDEVGSGQPDHGHVARAVLENRKCCRSGERIPGMGLEPGLQRAFEVGRRGEDDESEVSPGKRARDVAVGVDRVGQDQGHLRRQARRVCPGLPEADRETPGPRGPQDAPKGTELEHQELDQVPGESFGLRLRPIHSESPEELLGESHLPHDLGGLPTGEVLLMERRAVDG